MKLRKRGLLLIALAVMLLPVAAQTDSGFGRFHALVIGNQNYRHLSKLQTPLADAKAVAEVLKTQYGFTVDLLLDKSRDEIKLALSELRKTMTDERDNLLIYYAGHGYLDKVTGTGYWQPVDAEKDNDVYWLPTDEISRLLKAVRARHVLIVADSCYSGSLLMRDSGARLPASMGQDEWLRRMQARRSRTALTSGGEEPVADGGGSGHSVFAKALLEVLLENKEILDGDSLHDRIKRIVSVNAGQTPQYGDVKMTGHEMGDFLLVPKEMQEREIQGKPESKADLDFLKRGDRNSFSTTFDISAAVLTAHNQWRAKVGVPDIQWSDKLAGAAQTWANHIAARCVPIHNGSGNGENIFLAGPMLSPDSKKTMLNITPQYVVDAWGDESKNYDYASNSCSSICGHYTQLVWRDTREVGCGMSACGNENYKSQVWVCNYFPAGNIAAQKPY